MSESVENIAREACEGFFANPVTRQTAEACCADAIRRALEGARVREDARPEAEWHEDHGPVLWWIFPVSEAPWVGTPLDSDWPEYHTHWTPLPPIPAPLARRVRACLEGEA